MLELERKARNVSKLMEMHPAFRVRVEAVLKELERYGYHPRIELAWLSPLEQLNAYRQGRSNHMFSFHNISGTTGVKEALAADIWNDYEFAHQQTNFMLHLLATAEANGLTTGIRWELKPDQIEKINDAVKIKNWDAIIFPGREPLHLEVTGITIEAAQNGKRPPLPGEILHAPEAVAAQPGKEIQTMHYKVQNTDTGLATDYTLNTAFRPMTFLAVPYVSQFGTGADAHQNDCGAAAAVMLLRAVHTDLQMTPDDFYATANISGDPYLTALQLKTALASQGVQTDLRSSVNVQDVFALLAAGKPVIVLSRYSVLSDAGLTEKTFDGPHFSVMVGMDIKNVYLHDPLYTDPANGEAHAYPLDVFWKAWKDTPNDPQFPNPERSALVPATAVGFWAMRKVRVNISQLNIRKDPAANGVLVGTLKKDQVVDIVHELNGWGEVAGVGWISLAYTLPA